MNRQHPGFDISLELLMSIPKTDDGILTANPAGARRADLCADLFGPDKELWPRPKAEDGKRSRDPLSPLIAEIEAKYREWCSTRGIHVYPSDKAIEGFRLPKKQHSTDPVSALRIVDKHWDRVKLMCQAYIALVYKS